MAHGMSWFRTSTAFEIVPPGPRRRRDPATWLATCLLASALLGAPGPGHAQQLIARFPPPAARPVPRRELPPLPAALAAAPQRSVASTARSWGDLVGKAKLGRRVGVWLTDATVLKGDLLAIDDTSLTLTQRGGPRLVPARDVLRVRYLTHASRYALLAGVAVADGTCAILESGSRNPQVGECLDMVTVVFGLPMGGIASLLVRGRDLYRAPPAPAPTSPTTD